ncbi:hypothetical protein LTR95_018452 [Oleoguttula sp. CCFEE 5521]
MNPLPNPLNPSPYARDPQQASAVHSQQAQYAMAVLPTGPVIPPPVIQHRAQSLHQNSGVIQSQTTTSSTTMTTTTHESHHQQQQQVRLQNQHLQQAVTAPATLSTHHQQSEHCAQTAARPLPSVSQQQTAHHMMSRVCSQVPASQSPYRPQQLASQASSQLQTNHMMQQRPIAALSRATTSSIATVAQQYRPAQQLQNQSAFAITQAQRQPQSVGMVQQVHTTMPIQTQSSMNTAQGASQGVVQVQSPPQTPALTHQISQYSQRSATHAQPLPQIHQAMQQLRISAPLHSQTSTAMTQHTSRQTGGSGSSGTATVPQVPRNTQTTSSTSATVGSRNGTSTSQSQHAQRGDTSLQNMRRSPPPQTQTQNSSLQSRTTTNVKQSRPRSPPPQVASSSVTKETQISRRPVDPSFSRRWEHQGSTTIAGYNTTRWGGKERQQASKESSQALAEYDDEISDHIAHASMGICPMNWRWYPVKRGYLCGGTKHLISYEEAEATKRGERRETGPFVESVNIAPGPAIAAMGFERTRSITPPPGPGDGIFMIHGALPKNAAGWYFNGSTYVKDKPEYWPWDE